jgi:hypothetical protein
MVLEKLWLESKFLNQLIFLVNCYKKGEELHKARASRVGDELDKHLSWTSECAIVQCNFLI